MPDVADGEELPDAIFLGLGAVALVLEVGLTELHVDGADLSGSELIGVVVVNANLRTRPGFSHRTGEATPLLRRDERAPALGRRVVFVDRVTPPVEHPALDVGRTGRSSMDHVTRRRHVV